VSKLHVKIPWLYFSAYVNILLTSLEDSKWRFNIHGTEEHEARGNEKVEVYYEQIQKLGHGLQVPTINNFLTIIFRMGLQSYLRIATLGMKGSTLQHHMEVIMLCEKCMPTTKARSALSIS
jgi:hypothetical protein